MYIVGLLFDNIDHNTVFCTRLKGFFSSIRHFTNTFYYMLKNFKLMFF